MKRKYRIHPIFSDLIPAALAACDGTLFDSRSNCPYCGGSLARYDIKTKHFADLIDGSSSKTLTVRIARFRCHGCRAVVYADQPFYPNTRIGSPVVDLCVTLSTSMPFARAATCLRQMGLNVDRWSVRNYAMKIIREIPTTEQYGIVLPESIHLTCCAYIRYLEWRFNRSDGNSNCLWFSILTKTRGCTRKAMRAKEGEQAGIFPFSYFN